MRFWGAQGVYADAFAPLVEKDAGGIRTSVLTRDLERRGWRTDAGPGTLARLAAEVRSGRPVIALIEDRPNRYHYVVVVSANEAGAIVLHDPARAPSRIADAASFDRRWEKADRWMLVMQPPAAGIAGAAPATDSDAEITRASRPTACSPRVEAAVARANEGERGEARRLLTEATASCPRDAAAWRELAGLDALDQRWDAAADHAARAVAIDPADRYAWRLVATSQYLRHDDLAALAAWNRLGEPRLDLTEISGLRHTRYRVIDDAIGIAPQEIVTPGALRVAQKRVRDIPAIATARVVFRPLERGTAKIDAAIVERDRAPLAYPAWIGIGANAIANREVATTFANVTGGGDAVDVAWRWWEHRPLVAASYAAPGPFGVWRIGVARETQTFGADRFEQTRTRVGADVSHWLADGVRVGAGVAMDRWQEIGRTVALAARAEYWPIADRVAIDGAVSGWRGSGSRFGAAETRVRWISRPATTGTVLLAAAGYQFASESAPAFIWPGADTGHARTVLLRAHPLLDDGVIEDGVFGRRVSFASIEAQRWLAPKWHGLLRVAPAVFLDTARATHGLPGFDARRQFDAGAGLRLSLPGAGVLRIDVAHGLRDGQTALSVGWQR